MMSGIPASGGAIAGDPIGGSPGTAIVGGNAAFASGIPPGGVIVVGNGACADGMPAGGGIVGATCGSGWLGRFGYGGAVGGRGCTWGAGTPIIVFLVSWLIGCLT